MSKEQIYDEQISPLMAQILLICKEHMIPVVASFHTPGDDDDGLCVTSALIGNGFDAPKEFSDMLRAIRPDMFPSQIPMTRIHHGDGSITIEAHI